MGGESFDYDVEGWEGHSDFMVNVLGGFNIPLNETFALKLEARDCVTWFDSSLQDEDTRDTQNDLMLLAGLSVRFPFGSR